MLCVENERDIHASDMDLRRLLAVQQAQKMCGDGVFLRLGVDTLAVCVEAVPVEQDAGEGGQQSVGNLLLVLEITFRLEIAEHRAAGAQNIHRMRVGGNHLEHLAQGLRQLAQGHQTLFVGLELLQRRQLAVVQKVRNLLEGRVFGEIIDVVSTIGQPSALFANRGDGGAACDHAGKAAGFFLGCVVHVFSHSRCKAPLLHHFLPNNSSSLVSYSW